MYKISFLNGYKLVVVVRCYHKWWMVAMAVSQKTAMYK